MKILWRELLAREEPVAAVIHSLDQALYQVTIILEGREHLLCDDNGKPLRAHSLTRMRESLQFAPLASLSLRQQSAYDEMIGQPLREGDNAMEVPLALEPWPAPTRQ